MEVPTKTLEEKEPPKPEATAPPAHPGKVQLKGKFNTNKQTVTTTIQLEPTIPDKKVEISLSQQILAVMASPRDQSICSPSLVSAAIQSEEPSENDDDTKQKRISREKARRFL